jgi:GT2 family glycosyltransferase
MSALVDVVMLSKGYTTELKEMTQTAIDTCIVGTSSPVNVIIIEQEPGVCYQNARTVFAVDEFNYNRFANRGVQMGCAPWIMISNNDVIFHDGWLDHLLAVDHPVVCPCPPKVNPLAVDNQTGYENRTHFSGWCFMMRREIWRRIGGFDEAVNFWCSDDVVLEQLRKINTPSMKVPAAVVEHLMSATIDGQSHREELLWPNMQIFSEKYGRDKFENDADYLAWKLRDLVARIAAKDRPLDADQR